MADVQLTGLAHHEPMAPVPFEQQHIYPIGRWHMTHIAVGDAAGGKVYLYTTFKAVGDQGHYYVITEARFSTTETVAANSMTLMLNNINWPESDVNTAHGLLFHTDLVQGTHGNLQDVKNLPKFPIILNQPLVGAIGYLLACFTNNVNGKRYLSHMVGYYYAKKPFLMGWNCPK